MRFGSFCSYQDSGLQFCVLCSVAWMPDAEQFAVEHLDLLGWSFAWMSALRFNSIAITFDVSLAHGVGQKPSYLLRFPSHIAATVASMTEGDPGVETETASKNMPG